MLNTSIKLGSNSQSVTFNNPSTGMLQRSHSKSYFLRFQKTSEMKDWIFDPDPVRKIKTQYGNYDEVKIYVLQIMVFGDDCYLVECVDKKDIEE